MTAEKMKKHLDLMEMMVGHTPANGFRPVHRYGNELLSADINRETVMGMHAITNSQAERHLNSLKTENPEKQYDVQKGDSLMEDGSMTFWYIISEKI